MSKHRHQWQRPLELVGGLKENPGVFDDGGKIRTVAVCCTCGKIRRVVTSYCGRSYEDSREILPATKNTLEWVKSGKLPGFYVGI